MKLTLQKLVLLSMATILMGATSWGQSLPEAKNSHYVTTYKEFDEAAKHAAAGDHIILANGNWTDMEFKVRCNGEQDNMIYIRAEEPGKVFIDGASQFKIGGDYIHLSGLCFTGCVATSPEDKGAIILMRADSKDESYHSVISDCHFDSCVPQDKSFDDVWINLYGQYNTVERCYMGGKDNKGLYIVIWHRNDKADYHTIRDNYFYRPESVNNGENGQEIIRIGDSNNSLTDSSSTIERNFFYQCNGEVEILSIKSGDNTIRGNTFVECQGAVTLRHGNYNRVEDNIFLANGVDEAGGVRVINKGHKVINNYFYGHVSDDTRAPISLMGGVENGALNTYNQVEDAEIYNNTLADCRSNFSFCVVGKNTTLDPVNVTISGTLVVASCSKKELIDDNGGDVSGITFVDSHLEGKNGIAQGDGYLEAEYSKESLTIAEIEFPLYRAKSGIGATLKEEIATPDNCGPSWRGWHKPL